MIKRIIEDNRSMKILKRNMFIEKREIFKFRDKNGNVTSNRQQILEIVEDFYKELYKSRQDKNNNLKIPQL
jgi:predicted transcriptional regulator